MTGKKGTRGCATRQHFKPVVGKNSLLHLQQNLFQTIISMLQIQLNMSKTKI